jgi:hypothetical protein
MTSVTPLSFGIFSRPEFRNLSAAARTVGSPGSGTKSGHLRGAIARPAYVQRAPRAALSPWESPPGSARDRRRCRPSCRRIDCDSFCLRRPRWHDARPFLHDAGGLCRNCRRDGSCGQCEAEHGAKNIAHVARSHGFPPLAENGHCEENEHKTRKTKQPGRGPGCLLCRMRDAYAAFFTSALSTRLTAVGSSIRSMAATSRAIRARAAS